MPLAFASKNRELEIKKVNVQESIRKHLQEMGITVGGKITLLSSDCGNVIVIVKEGRLCLDKTLAGRILVA